MRHFRFLKTIPDDEFQIESYESDRGHLYHNITRPSRTSMFLARMIKMQHSHKTINIFSTRITLILLFIVSIVILIFASLLILNSSSVYMCQRDVSSQRTVEQIIIENSHCSGKLVNLKPGIYNIK